ncbi:MAG: hypothetical protein JW884_06635 [Deltaproteobacteria bacterium]|nr:hypothetical protein [Deltaproteobacteria bacterium]
MKTLSGKALCQKRRPAVFAGLATHRGKDRTPENSGRPSSYSVRNNQKNVGAGPLTNHGRKKKAANKPKSILQERTDELKRKSRELEEINATLRVLLKNRDEDRKVLEDKMLANLRDLVMPYIEHLRTTKLDKEQLSCLNIIDGNLNDIVSPFSRKLSSAYINLTPKEIQVAGLVRDAKTNKEIAALCNISINTVEFYRSNIRRKLGLTHKKTNLVSYLMTIS